MVAIATNAQYKRVYSGMSGETKLSTSILKEEKMLPPEEIKLLKHFGALAVAGLIAGIGAMLISKDIITIRLAAGRALSSAALGVSAASIITVVPTVDFIAQVGMACLAGSIGTTGLEKILQRFLDKK